MFDLNSMPVLPVIVFSMMGCKSHTTITEKAIVKVNGAYDFSYGEPATALGIVIAYDKCPAVEQAFRLEKISDAGMGSLEPTPEERKCLESLTVNSKVSVTMETTKNNLTGMLSWSVKKIDTCIVKGLAGTVGSMQEDKMCSWM